MYRPNLANTLNTIKILLNVRKRTIGKSNTCFFWFFFIEAYDVSIFFAEKNFVIYDENQFYYYK